MKTLIYLTILNLFNFSVMGQNLDIIWQQCFGGSSPDGAWDIVSVDNGYFIAGGTGSNDGDVSFLHGLGDGWLIRIDSTGNLLWEKTYGGSDSEAFSKIIPTSDNNFYLLGISWSSDGDISNDPYPGSPDYWIVKIDSSGNILWDKIVGGNEGEALFTGDATLDGGIVASGWTYSTDGDISVSYGGADTWAVKISSEGELEWDYTIGTDWIDKGQAILATSDGGYLIASNSSIHEDAIGNITCTPHSYGWFEGVLFKLDSNLNIQWQRCYGGSDQDGIFGIIETDDGYVFTGSTSSNDGDVSGWHGESDAWVVKIDFDGNIEWQNPLGGSGSESGSNLLQTSDGHIISIVNTDSNNGDVSGNHGLSEFDSDIWFVKLSSAGELLFQQCFGGAGSEIVEFGVVKKSDNNFVIAGYTDYGPSFDVGCTPHGGQYDEDFWVFEIKDCSQYMPVKPETPLGTDTVCTIYGEPSIFGIEPVALAWDYDWALQPDSAGTIGGDSLQVIVTWNPAYEGTVAVIVRSHNDCGYSEWSQPHYVQVNSCIGTNEYATSRMMVYPNPAKDFVEFKVESFEFKVGGQISVFGMLGDEVARLEVKDGRAVWDCRGMPRGIYFWKYECEGENLTGKIILNNE